jgi:hypothetical protein
MKNVTLQKLDPDSDREEPQNFSKFESVAINSLNMRVVQLEICDDLAKTHIWNWWEGTLILQHIVNKRVQLINEYLK